jgi:capsular polysaccharide biosynthesis protein
MSETGIYRGKEPADERLLLLCYLKNLELLVALILALTLLGGGLYCLRYVVFAEDPMYRAQSDYLVHYTVPYEGDGDYFVNYYTWTSYLQSDRFLRELREEVGALYPDSKALSLEDAQLAQYLSAEIKSDINVPSFYVTCRDAQLAEELSKGIEKVWTGAYGRELMGVDYMEVLTGTRVENVSEAPRIARAFLFSLVVSAFFVHLIYLLRETAADSIYLPVTLRRRYGIPALGTICSPELSENLKAVYAQDPGAPAAERPAGSEEELSILVVPATDQADSEAVCRALRAVKGAEAFRFVPMPAPMLAPESAALLRKAQRILLAVPAGSHVGKPLERTLAFFDTQQIRVAAGLLWEADEKLLKWYYRISSERDTE